VILQKSMDALTADDINQLCADQISESGEVELKADLPHKDGLGKDPWHSSGGIGGPRSQRNSGRNRRIREHRGRRLVSRG
jgi:hypothetical protein